MNDGPHTTLTALALQAHPLFEANPSVAVVMRCITVGGVEQCRAVCTDILHIPERVLVAQHSREATAASTGNLDMVLPFQVRPHDNSDAARWNRTSLGPMACAGLTCARTSCSFARSSRRRW